MAKKPQRRVWRAGALCLGIGVALVLLEAVQTALIRAGGGQGEDRLIWMFIGFIQPWALFALLLPLIVLFARRFPLRQRPALTVVIHLGGALTFAVVHVALMTLAHLVQTPGDVAFGKELLLLLGSYLLGEILLYAAVTATVLVLDARRELRDRELAAAELQASLAEARLHALRGQLHPHFLFNALNSVSMLVREERPQESLAVLAELGALLRRLFADTPGHEVTLAAELEFSRRYLALEQIRFGDRLAVSFDCEPGLEDALVPNLVLQPLVENAVRHGVARHAGAGRVGVRAFCDGTRLAIEVWNDGPAPPADAAAGAGTGLRTTRGRLASLYGDEQDLALAAAPSGGAVARVSVPLHTRPLAVHAA